MYFGGLRDLGKNTSSDTDDRRCVGLNGVLLFLSNLNSNEPDPSVSSSLFHSLFLSQIEQELWL